MNALALFAPLLLGAASAPAEEPRASFALILGVNQGVDPELPRLRYADDDAARYQELFRTLGARTTLLASLDENTARLHPQALAEAHPPRKAELDRVLASLAEDVARAKAQGVLTEVFFVFAGHGNVKDGQAYLSLEDARLPGKDLAEALAGVPAARIHVVVDACYSYFLAYGRGAGGQRRAIAPGFSQAAKLASDERIGLLLSTSSARESHEWEGFQGGVFSHEIRSGLFGAADVDGDGVVGYREIAAFVQRANGSVPNEKYRPDVWAKPPQGTDAFVDLRGARKRRLEIGGEQAGRYLLEDSRGVRLADFHSAPGQALGLLRPMAAPGALYLRRLADEREFAIAGSEDVVALSALSPAEPRVHGRGAAHDAFQRLFDLPFDRAASAAFSLPPSGIGLVAEAPGPSLSPRKIGGIAVTGLGVAGLVGGVWTLVSTQGIRDGASSGESQRATALRNERIQRGNTTAVAVLSAAGVAVVGGLVLALWPEDYASIVLVPDAQHGGAYAGIAGRF